MADIDIQRLRYDQKEVGKTFSSSKILYTWEFILNKKSHRIEFFDSRLSDKKKTANKNIFIRLISVHTKLNFMILVSVIKRK